MKQLEEAVEFIQERLADVAIDDFEIYARGVEGLEVESKDQCVESLTRTREHGVALRVIKGGRMGMSSSSDFGEEALARVIAHAVEVACQVESVRDANFPPPRSQVTPLPERPGTLLADIPERDKIDAAKGVERAALDADPHVVRVRNPIYSEVSTHAMLTNSAGIVERAQRSLVFCEATAVAEERGSSEMASECGHHIRFEDLDCEEIGRKAGRRAAAMLGAEPVPTGRYRVYLEPRAVAAMLRVLMPSFFADNVQRKKSRLAGKLRCECFSPLITIVDDGLLPGGAGSFLFDGEGVWHQRTVVVGSGIVKGWLHDSESSLRDEVASTGNASRPSIHASPQIAITNSFIEEGQKSPADLVSSCERGLCISDLMGLHTANVVSGDFSLGAVGFTVEGGKRGRPVRGVMLAGNVMDFFRCIDGVGNDLTFFGRYGAPSFTARDVQVNGT